MIFTKRRVILGLASAVAVAAAVAASFAVVRAHDAEITHSTGRAREVRIRILSTMLAEAGIGEWGFAALVEVDGHRVLFDTGHYRDTVLRNAKELKIDLSDVEEVVLSHNHGDHTGGLLALRNAVFEQNSTALSKAHVGKGIFASRRAEKGKERETNPMIAVKPRYEETGATFVEHDAPVELYPGVWLTGPVPRVYPERNWSGAGVIHNPDGDVEDTIPEDQSLVIDTDKGLVVLSGCGHAGMINTFEYVRKTVRNAPIHAAIGGFHLFEANEKHLAWTAEKLKGMGLQNLLGAHCTGIEAVFSLRAKAGLSRETCVVGAVGASFSLEKGLDPLKLAR